MKYNRFKRTKNLVGYSESFIFRARCRFCWSKPNSKVYDIAAPYFESKLNFVKNINKNSYFITNSFFSFFGNLIKSSGHYSNGVYPNNFHKLKNNSYYKTMTCTCGKTWWAFKEMSPTRSINRITPQ